MEPTAIPESVPAREPDGDVVELLERSDTDHPALERLRARMSEAAPVEATITSYDRLHHRHNRS